MKVTPKYRSRNKTKKQNYEWTRLRTAKGYVYTKTRNGQAIEYSPNGFFRVYEKPDSNSHSYETTFENAGERDIASVQRKPDNHAAAVAQQKEIDKQVNATSLTPDRFLKMMGASGVLAGGALGAVVAAPVVGNTIMESVVNPVSDYIGSTAAGQMVTKGLSSPYFSKGLEAAFAGHGLNHVVNEGIDGWEDAATTAVELTPLASLAKPLYKGVVQPGIRLFNSPLTGKWTQIGGREYRFSPSILGMNGGAVESRPVSYGYDRSAVAKAAKEEFTDKTRRPLLIRQANEDNTLADALDKTINGTSETRFGTGNRTLTEPGPHEVLTGTYWDLQTGQPIVRGSGLLGTEPIPVTATEGSYKSSGKFGNLSSVTDSMLGGGKYGFRNWDELEDYVLNLDLNKEEFNYIADLINRTKSFENGIKLGPETTDGLLPKPLRNKETQYQQYLADQAELSDWLMGNMKYGAKNQRVIYSAPKPQQIIIGKSNDPGYRTRTANIKMPLKSVNGNFSYYKSAKLNEKLWPNGMVPEDKISHYNSLPSTDKLRILIQSDHPQILFPLHFRGTGPNPFSGMTTMQVKGIRSTFKKGGKIKVSVH